MTKLVLTLLQMLCLILLSSPKMAFSTITMDGGGVYTRTSCQNTVKKTVSSQVSGVQFTFESNDKTLTVIKHGRIVIKDKLSKKTKRFLMNLEKLVFYTDNSLEISSVELFVAQKTVILNLSDGTLSTRVQLDLSARSLNQIWNVVIQSAQRNLIISKIDIIN